MRLVVPIVVLMVVASACGSPAERMDTPRSVAPGSAEAGRRTQEAQTAAPKIVILGDSLTAGLGLPVGQSYPSLLQERLKTEGMNYQIVNAGVSGDTSAGGLSRLDWALEGDVRVLVVALGGNDALRGLSADQLKQNLATIIERARARGITVMLAGMESPPNWGRDYNVAFHEVYPALAKEYKVPLVPFLLEGVAGSETLNQKDGIHPSAAGARVVADNVWKVLKPLLDAKGHPSTGSGSSRAPSRDEVTRGS